MEGNARLLDAAEWDSPLWSDSPRERDFQKETERTDEKGAQIYLSI